MDSRSSSSTRLAVRSRPLVLYWLSPKLGMKLRNTVAIAAGLVVLLAGLSLVGSVGDVITGAPVTAAGRFFELVMMTGATIAGVALVLHLANRFGAPFVAISAECDTRRQLCQGGRRIRADGDERRTEAVGEVQHQRHTGDRRARHHDQLEEAARSGDRGTGDDVADRAHQRKAGEKHDQAGRDGHGRFELQSQLGAEPVEHQRGRGRDRTANRVLEEERESVPVESPIDAVDRHGTQSADQADQPDRRPGFPPSRTPAHPRPGWRPSACMGAAR